MKTANRDLRMAQPKIDEAQELGKILASISREVLEQASGWEVAVLAAETFVAGLRAAARRQGHAIPYFYVQVP